MVRHVCGTCRFFQAHDPNRKSGWCGHPQRQTTTDVHILVRAGELNCRNDWDKDLWQLREDGDRVLDISMVKSADHANPSRREHRPDAPRTLGHDAPRVSEPLPPPDDIVIGEEHDAPRLVSEDINREMLRRAREQYRARRQTTRPDGPSPRLGDTTAPTLHRPEPIVISNEVHPFQIGKEAGPDLTRISGRDRAAQVDDASTSGSDGGRFSSVPEVQDTIELPRRPTRRLEAIPTINDFEMESLRSYDEVVEVRKSGPTTGTLQDQVVSRPVEETREPDRAPWQTEDFDVYDELDELTAEAAADAHDENRPSLRPSSAGQSDVARPVDRDDIRPWDYVEPRRPRSSEIDARESERMTPPSLTKLWDDIPRCCRTCRDFRPAEAGGRGGWCTNRWAFRHRRMVDIDELTCETTIGDWWLPTDDAWQDNFDVGRHALATPLMDKWFGRFDEEIETDYPAVASRTRRRS